MASEYMDQLALLDVGRPILSQRNTGADGDGQCNTLACGLSVSKDYWVSFPYAVNRGAFKNSARRRGLFGLIRSAYPSGLN